ncbi:hypothetical protein ABK040_010002 [Willaertia magna]
MSSLSDYGGGLFVNSITNNSRTFQNPQHQQFNPNNFLPTNNVNFNENNNPPTNLLLAVRIMDGLFVGNAIAAQDDEFLFSNKVTHVVNCAGLEVANVFAEHGIEYLTFPWRDVPTTVLLDNKERNISRIVKFLDQAFDKGECALIHSYHGNSRSCAIIAAYFVYKFQWTFESTMSFLQVAHPDMKIKNYFLRQVKDFSKRLKANRDIFNIEIDQNNDTLGETILKNTYLNSLPVDDNTLASFPVPPKKPKKKLTFSMKEEPPTSRHLVSTIDPKTKERIPIRGILKTANTKIPRPQSAPASTISSYDNSNSIENTQRILEVKPRMSLIDPETGGLDDSDSDGLQILTGAEANKPQTNSIFNQPTTLTIVHTNPTTSNNIPNQINNDIKSVESSETDEIESLNEDNKKKKKKNTTSNTTKKRPTTFSAPSTRNTISTQQTQPPVISHNVVKFRKPTPPKKSDNSEKQPLSVLSKVNIQHRLNKNEEDKQQSLEYTGTLPSTDSLFLKVNHKKQSSGYGNLNGNDKSLQRTASISTLLQPTISSSLKKEGMKKRPASAPKSRPSAEDNNELISSPGNNIKEKFPLRSSFSGNIGSSSLKTPTLTTNKTAFASTFPPTLSVPSSPQSKKKPKINSKRIESRLMKPTLSFLSKTVTATRK